MLLDDCRGTPPYTCQLATGRGRTETQLSFWSSHLACHPDGAFAEFILEGLRQGFRIGVQRSALNLRQARSNMPSSSRQLQLISSHLQAEVAAGRLLGTLPPALAALTHVSPLGLIPKPHKPGKWRLIVNLSALLDHSINDFIDVQASSIRYASIDNGVRVITRLGRRTILAKLDLKSAYRMVPVHPDDVHLLGVKWLGSVYVDTALPNNMAVVAVLNSSSAKDSLLMHLLRCFPSTPPIFNLRTPLRTLKARATRPRTRFRVTEPIHFSLSVHRPPRPPHQFMLAWWIWPYSAVPTGPLNSGGISSLLL